MEERDGWRRNEWRKDEWRRRVDEGKREMEGKED